MAGKRYWSNAQRDEFVRLCLMGLPRDEIAAKMRTTVCKVASLYYGMRERGFKGRLAPRQSRPGTSEDLEAKAPEVRRLADAGFSHRAIADRLQLTRHRVLKYVTAEKLIPEERLKNRPAHRRQEMQLPVNLHRVRLPDVNEADVRLARQFWREFEKAP